MGKQSYSIENIFDNRPTIETYSLLKGKVKEFVDDVIKDSIKPNKVLRLKGKELNPKQENLWFLTWGDMVELRETISEMKMIESLKLIYEIKEEDFLRLDVFNCFAVYKWITEQLKTIGKIEAQELAYTPTAKEKSAGIEELSEFGYALTLKDLTKDDKTKDEYYLNLTYAEIFRELCMRSKISDYTKNMLSNGS